MDEAASRLRMQVDSKPEELDELDRRIIQLKIEREALRKENDEASRDRLEQLEKELAELEEQSNAMTAAWQDEKKQVQETQKLKERAGPGAQRSRDGAAARQFGPRRRAALRRDSRPREEAGAVEATASWSTRR